MATSTTSAPASTTIPVNSASPAGTAFPAGGKPRPSASLYVGEIASDVTEGILFEIFNHVGPVASIRVCRDTITRRSLGYAYVNFHSEEDAERALDTLNNTPIKGRPCRIMWSQRDPSIRKSGVGNIFIKNLDPSIGHKELHDTFSAFGNILSCKVALDSDGNSRGYGFVHFESNEAAENAIQMVNDMQLGSKRVYVNHFKPRREREAEKESSWTNVYVKDLDEGVTDEELKQTFSQFGEVTSCVIMRDDEGNSKGFAFINFSRHEDAAKAVDAINGIDIKDKKVYAGRAQKKTERLDELKKRFEQIKMDRLTKYQGVNLYIKNLEDQVDEERVRKEFGTYGEIKSVKVMADEKGNSRGFGFVCYSAPEEAQRAITDMNGRILQGCTKPLYVALHEPKEMRRHKLAARHAAVGRGKGPGRMGAGIPQMYPGSQPVYYPPGAAPGGFLYPQQLIQRGPAQGPGQRGAWTGQQPYPPVPGYMMPTPQPTAQAATPQAAALAQSQAQQQRGTPAAAAAAGVTGAGPRPELTVQYLNSQSPERRKTMLGEKLYHLIERTHPQLAGKITGMFLDSGWSTEELLSLINVEEKLTEKIAEAVKVLEDARKKAAATTADS